ncbi:MAG: type I-E CRISPR-associated protein Cse2/CasB [Deltaproteobacteria bacterium]
MSKTDQLRQDLQAARRRYDGLRRGQTAALRRRRSADEVVLEAIYWHVGGALAHTRRDLPHVVLLFPLAPQLHSTARTFSFGRFLRRHLGDSDGAMLRFRRLLASGDRDELDHRLRGVLRLACADKSPVDWGVLGADILQFFNTESDHVRRRWAQDFYAPIFHNDADSAAATSNA